MDASTANMRPDGLGRGIDSLISDEHRVRDAKEAGGELFDDASLATIARIAGTTIAATMVVGAFTVLGMRAAVRMFPANARKGDVR